MIRIYSKHVLRVRVRSIYTWIGNALCCLPNVEIPNTVLCDWGCAEISAPHSVSYSFLTGSSRVTRVANFLGWALRRAQIPNYASHQSTRPRSSLTPATNLLINFIQDPSQTTYQLSTVLLHSKPSPLQKIPISIPLRSENLSTRTSRQGMLETRAYRAPLPDLFPHSIPRSSRRGVILGEPMQVVVRCQSPPHA
jgi:hypothetical protein